MCRVKRNVSIANLFAMMTAMWTEVHTGKVDAESINLRMYQDKYSVTKHRRAMILPYITQENVPTLEQAVQLRNELNKSNKKSVVKQQPIAVSKDLFSSNSFEDEKSIENAISLLKKNGYVIFREV